MEKNDLLNDDFLRNFVQKGSLESPSDDFVEKIMVEIKQQPEPVYAKTPYYYYLKSVLGYIALAAFVIFFVLSSDIFFFNFIPGKQYFSDHFLPFLNSIILPLKALFNDTKALTLPLMIIVSAGLLFVFDHLLTRKRVAQS